MGLAKFSIHTKTSLADSIYKTRRKWVINDFTKYNDNNLITLLMMNIGAEFATYIEKSLTICRYQVDELDCLDINDIDHVREDVVLSW